LGTAEDPRYRSSGPGRHDGVVTGQQASTGASGRRGGRQVYRSDPHAPTLDQVNEEFERLAGRIYVQARDGAVDFEAAFDLACFLIEWGPADPLVRQLAERSAEGTNRAQVREIALQVLAHRYRPGFDVEPAPLAVLEEALEAVKADMRSTGLAGPVRLVVPDWAPPRSAFVEFRGYGYGSTSGITPEDGSDPLSALIAVADCAQDSVIETLHEVWPLCPVHQLGAHPREHDAAAVWWCNGSRGHVIAPIGQWK
jgi:hypothetical protein